MSPDNEELVQDDDLQDEVDEIDDGVSKASKTPAKRRTKTGCLTCRKRRIKCGEERPICNNCIKSKRDCAGYNPPLVYKGNQNANATLPPYNINFVNGYTGYPMPTSHGLNTYQQDNIPHDSRLSDSFAQSYSGGYSGHPGFNGTSTDINLTQNNWEHLDQLQGISNNQSLPFPLQSIVNEHIPPVAHTTHTDVISPTTSHTASSVSGLFTGTGSFATPISPNFSINTATQTPIYSEYGFARKPSLKTNASPLERRGSDLNFHSGTSLNGKDQRRGMASGTNIHKSKQHEHDQQIHLPKKAASIDSPLSDESSQPIFQHFITFTGPCMSIFDRLDYTIPYQPPKMVWTHGLPSMAWEHSALAHAILALSALQLSRIGRGNQETALKHFTLALSQAGGLLASDESRHHVSTLATVLLLAYYEVIEGDHSRWSLHLSGAARLVMEHNYAALFRTVRRMRAKAKSNLDQSWVQMNPLSDYDYIRIADIPEGLLSDSDWEVDQALISNLTGMEIDFTVQVQHNFESESDVPELDETEVENLKILMEMYWWYCKQDIFQSMLSGDAPMLPYSKMKFCPPRGQIGQADRAHATMDYLWLILARLMAFGAKDRVRKLNVVASQGGQWIPPAGFLPIPPLPPSNARTGVNTQTYPAPVQQAKSQESRPQMPPTANEGRARKLKSPLENGSGASQPPMYGMIPPPAGPPQMSTSFNLMNAELKKDINTTPENSGPAKPSNADDDLETALAEHTSITKALDLFKVMLGIDFEPLPVDQHLTTPFGPPLRYASPTIATMWAFFYLSKILLRRLHPHSPPAAMVSAGVNAFVTREHAQTIGKICGGLYAQHASLVQAGQVDHICTAALMETTFPLLFAGVQFQDPAQRGWTISKLGDIAQATGWASASSIAAACETTWERMGMAGKGPPYTRTLDRGSADERVRGRNHDSPNPAASISAMDAVTEYTSRFVSHDRDLIDRHGSTRAHWALGLLSVEEDLKKMDLGNKDEEKKGK